MTQKDTVIFDLDGTLLDTLQDLKNSVNYALAENGLPERTLDEIRLFVGNGIRLLIERAVPADTELTVIDQVFDRFKRHYAVHCNDYTKPYDGIMELLQALKDRGIRMAIVSNKADFAVKELAHIYFDDLITVAIGEKESEGIRKKPAPDTVNEALEELGSCRENAVYVGDSEVDIATAANSKMDAILCDWGFRDRSCLEENGAKLILSAPGELLDALH
jgi:phosphoglycolate phosphatase